jgi:hypothetical protein
MLSGFNDREYRVDIGKTLFAQVMEFVPWKTFTRIIERHKGDAGVRTLGCADLFRVMALSQMRIIFVAWVQQTFYRSYHIIFSEYE